MNLKKAVAVRGIIAFTALIMSAIISCSNNEPGESYNIPTPTAITTAAIQGITAPVKGETPDTTAVSTGNFTVSRVSWSPDHNPFLGEKKYTVSVTLTANQGYTFDGLKSATIDGRDAAISFAHNRESAVSYTFPATDTRTAIDMIIETQPYLLTYEHGEPLDLTGLRVWLAYDDGSMEYVVPANFTAKNITTNPSQGDELLYQTHNGMPITVTYGAFTLRTMDNLTVMPEINTLHVDPIPDQIYTGDAITPEVTVRSDTAILRQDIDYDVFYSNNIQAGTAAVLITGINDYYGSFGSVTFTILQTVPRDRIEYYWVNQHDSLVTTLDDAATVAFGETLTITARSADYVVKQWHLDGVNTGQRSLSYKFSGIAPGTHTVGLFVEKDGKLYNTNIAITVAFRVTFSVNEGTGTPPASRIVAAGSAITLPGGSGLAKGNYTFYGWNTSADGNGYRYEAGSSYTPTDNVTLYAQWRLIITFDLNGGTGTAPYSWTLNYPIPLTIPGGSGFSKTGYYFNGWNTSADGTGINYYADFQYTPTGSVTLYANWSRTPITGNGTEASPFPLTSGAWSHGSIVSAAAGAANGAAVWYWFNVTNGNGYYIWWTDSRQQGSGKTMSVKVDVQYSDGTVLFSGRDSSSSPQSFVVPYGKSTVKVKVYPYISGTTGTFAVGYSTSNTRPQ
jgi:uncharacterized repeat protein (TIGR02543 family)